MCPARRRRGSCWASAPPPSPGQDAPDKAVGSLAAFHLVAGRHIVARQFAQAAQNDPAVKGYRSFANLAEGKAVCVMEASNKDAVAAWFTKMGMPFDTITKVELEGERGTIYMVFEPTRTEWVEDPELNRNGGRE